MSTSTLPATPTPVGYPAPKTDAINRRIIAERLIEDGAIHRRPVYAGRPVLVGRWSATGLHWQVAARRQRPIR
jgi:hypothetical protein